MNQEFEMNDEIRKKVWDIEINLLKKVINVCKKHNLRFFADSGTLLGAIRHNGFIPWDDDIDLAMPRKDYNKLCDIAKEEFDELYFFQTESTDPGSTRGHIQIRKSDTTGILYSEREKKFQFNQGVFIDIFPLDNIPNNNIVKKLFLMRANRKKLNSIRFRNITIGYQSEKGFKGTIKKILHVILIKIYNKKGNIFYKDFERYIQKYKNKNDTKYIADISLKPLKKKGFFKKEYYSDFIMKKFEDTEIPVPIEYEKVLDAIYKDWRTPIKAPNSHGDIFFDLENSYKKYI